MPRLKSLTEHPPYGFQMLQPETGQSNPFVGSFNYVVEQTMMLRNANPFLAERHGWRLDLPGIEHDVEQYNVARMIAGGWRNFIVEDDGPPQPLYVMPEKKTRPLANVAAIRNVAAGVGVLLQWLGSGGKPVDQSLADGRAAVCAGCPRNDGGDWTAYFTKPIADRIRTQLEIRNDLQLRTPYDDKLTVCSACSCPLKLKVFVGLDHIWDHTSADTYASLAPQCWIKSEGIAAGKTLPGTS